MGLLTYGTRPPSLVLEPERGYRDAAGRHSLGDTEIASYRRSRRDSVPSFVAATLGSVKRIYLDMKDWINLGRAYHGRADGARYRTPFLSRRPASRRVSSPSHCRPPITRSFGRRYEWRSRHRLAEVMEHLSRFHTMASLMELVPAEIDRALQARFGRPTQPRPLRPFGFGVRFAAHDPELRYKAPDELPEGVNRYEMESVLELPFSASCSVGQPRTRDSLGMTRARISDR